MLNIGRKQELIRKTNQSLIIDIVKKEGPISRANLAKTLKLSAPSISKNIDQLLKRNILKEIGKSESSGGRKAILLEFNSLYKYIIGVDLTSSINVSVALGDLLGNILDIEYFQLNEDKIGEKILEQTLYTIEKILDKHKINNRKIAAISVATPGVVNEETGELKMATQFDGWDKLNIKKIIENNFKTLVIVKNDINMAAIGECYYGIGKEFRNFIFISVDLGVGAGIIIDRKLYEGNRFAAGEIGFLLPNVENIIKNENFKNLESLIAIPSIINKIKNDLKKGHKSILINLVNNDIDKINFSVFKKAFIEGDGYCVKLVDEISRYLGGIIVNISMLLDFELVILGGSIIELGDQFIRSIRDIVDRLTPIPTKVLFTELGEKAGIYGAFAAANMKIFKNIID